MATKPLIDADRQFLLRLGERVNKIILKDLGYQSLDAFSIENSDHIAKPTLYQITRGERDMKVSTLRGLCRALDISIQDLIKGL